MVQYLLHGYWMVGVARYHFLEEGAAGLAEDLDPLAGEGVFADRQLVLFRLH